MPRSTLPERAVRDAVHELAVPGLSDIESKVIAAVAANRAAQTLPATATDTERYAAMNAAARAALAAVKARGAYRRSLVGGIESLTYQQQMAIALRVQEDLNNSEIAAVMGLTVPEVRVLLLSSFQHLGDVT